MHAEDGSTLAIKWDEAVAELATCGWARAPHAIDKTLAAELAKDDGRRWRVAGDEGVVRQYVVGSYTPLAQAPAIVGAIGDEVVARLSAAAERQDLPALPRFDEEPSGS